MKKMKWVLGTLLLAIIPLLAWVGVAKAQHFASTIPEDQTVYSTVYATGKEINIKGTIYGDVFCAGQKVVVDATVYGDVICAGIDVTVSGKVEGDVRIAGQLVAMGGETGKNATVAALNFSLDADAKVGQDLTANGENLTIKGAVGRDLVTTGNSMILNGKTGRNVRAASASVQLKNEARVGGDLYYTSTRDAQIDQGAQITGKTNHVVEHKSGRGFNLMLYLFAVVSLTLIGTILAFLFPRFMRRTSDQISANVPKAMITGLLGSILALVACIGLLVTLAGAPLALVVLVALLVGAILSGPITAYYVGSLVLRKAKNTSPVLLALVGGPLLVTLYHLPFLGVFFMLLAFWLGFGSLLRTLHPYVGSFAPATTKKK